MIDEEILHNGEKPVILIDRDKCIGCKMCSKVCNRKLFDYDKSGAVFKGPNSICMGCTQCVAICPVNAIARRMSDGTIQWGEDLPYGKIKCDPELMFNQIKARRTIRAYRNKPIEEEKIEKLTRVMDMAPKGSNRKLFRAIFITKDVEKYRTLFLSELKEIAKNLPVDSPLISGSNREECEAKRLNMMNFYGRYISSGIDGLTYKAPMIFILIADKDKGGKPFWDSGITCAYMENMALSMGLGCCYLGFAMTAAEKSDKIKEAFELKENEMFAGIMSFGYPEYSYKRTTPREKTPITWL